MSLKQQIEDMLEFEDVVVAETETTNIVGKPIYNYAINKHGVVLQFSIPVEEQDPGVIEDFLEYIESAIQEID